MVLTNGHSTNGQSHRRVAIVTGGGSGIGRTCAIALGKAGWAVTIVGRRKTMLEETAAEMESCLIQAGDLTDSHFVREMFAATKEHFGRLDLLFNNAGMASPAVPFEDVKLDDFMACVNINLVAPFLCTQEAFKLFKSQEPQGGRIINNGSISAYVPRPNSVAYTSTKHAISGLTKSSALDGRKYNIAVSQLDIGNAQTSLTNGMGMNKGSEQADGSKCVEPHMDVAYVGQTLVYMASLPLSVNIQNQTLLATNMPSWIGRG